MKPSHLQSGEDAEAAAAVFLLSNDLTLVENNFTSRHGEIDLIMRDGNTLVFVEVRYRKSDMFGGAIESVGPSKQLKIRNTAEVFLQRHQKLNFDQCRFDVVAVSGQPPRYTFDWISNAF